MSYPIYNEALLRNLPKGLYLGLMHGRDSEDEELSNWGVNGALIGPLNYCHTTYGGELKLEFTEGNKTHLECYEALFPDIYRFYGSPCYVELYTNKDNSLVICDGKYYGDWCVFYNDEGR